MRKSMLKARQHHTICSLWMKCNGGINHSHLQVKWGPSRKDNPSGCGSIIFYQHQNGRIIFCAFLQSLCLYAFCVRLTNYHKARDYRSKIWRPVVSVLLFSMRLLLLISIWCMMISHNISLDNPLFSSETDRDLHSINALLVFTRVIRTYLTFLWAL